MNVLLLYRAALISIDGRVLTIPTEGSRVGCQSRARRRRWRTSTWQGNRRYIKASTATARRNVVGASISAVDKGKKRKGVRFQLVFQFKEPGSNDSN